MKITLETEKGTYVCTLPFRQAEHVEAGTSCPHCKAEPLLISGVKGTRETTRDTITERAGCRACNKDVGKLVVKMDTLFGMEEDERVLNGRFRVY